MKPVKIYNSKGEEVILNAREKAHALMLQNEFDTKFKNALGFEVPITTLTTIVKKVSEQKFFEVMPADYIPVKVGNGAFSSNLLTYREYEIGGSFADGVINLAKNKGRLASMDAGIDSVSIKIRNWVKSIDWTIFEVNEAAKSGNWDLITAKEKSRLKNWQLGIQEVAFLGLDGDAACVGLLGLIGITTNTDIIQVPISSMSGTDLKQFCETVLNAYRQNCSRTAWPTHFIIPESDYLGLAGMASADFPIRSTLSVLEEVFQTMTKNKNFKILPLTYCDVAYHPGATQQQYVLLNYDEESINMNIPVDYTSTLAGTINNFQYQNTGYGQFTGVQAIRPSEILYFKFTPAS